MKYKSSTRNLTSQHKAGKREPTKSVKPSPFLERLEDRTLFSVDFLALPPTDTADDIVVAEQPFSESTADDQTNQTTDLHQTPVELVFIDSTVPDISFIIEDLKSQQQTGRLLEVVVLDANEDGLSEITSALEGRTVSAIHILSHGSASGLQLGATWLNAEAALESQSLIQSWQDSLTDNADLLLYGCNLTTTESGAALVDLLSTLTNADVATSDNATGHQKFDADWVLENSTGAIEAEIIASNSLQEAWEHSLLTGSDGIDILYYSDDSTLDGRAGNDVFLRKDLLVGAVGDLGTSFQQYQSEVLDYGNITFISHDPQGSGLMVPGEGYAMAFDGTLVSNDSAIPDGTRITLPPQISEVAFEPGVSYTLVMYLGAETAGTHSIDIQVPGNSLKTREVKAPAGTSIENVAWLPVIYEFKFSNNNEVNRAEFIISSTEGKPMIAALRLSDDTSGSDGMEVRDGAGDDVVLLGGGEDTIYNGPGDDYIRAGDDDDTIYDDGDDGKDKIYGGDGDDTIFDGIGNDTIVGGSGNDTITDGPGKDRINAGSGDDIINIYAPSSANEVNVFNGGADNDTFNLKNNVKSEFTIVAGSGTDSLVLEHDDSAGPNTFLLPDNFSTFNSGLETIEGTKANPIVGDASYNEPLAWNLSQIGDIDDDISFQGGTGDDKFAIAFSNNNYRGGDGTDVARVFGNFYNFQLHNYSFNRSNFAGENTGPDTQSVTIEHNGSGRTDTIWDTVEYIDFNDVRYDVTNHAIINRPPTISNQGTVPSVEIEHNVLTPLKFPTLDIVDSEMGYAPDNNTNYTLLFEIPDVNPWRESGNLEYLNTYLDDLQRSYLNPTTDIADSITVSIYDPGKNPPPQYLGNPDNPTYLATIPITILHDPVLSEVENNKLTYTEGAPGIGLTSNVVVTDLNTTIESATITIANVVPTEDILEVTNAPATITSAYDANTGTLTLTGADTAQNYQNLLRSITYKSTSDAPNTTDRTIEFYVDDGHDKSNLATRLVSLVNVNDAPQISANTGAESIVGEASLITKAMLNEGDPDDDGAELNYNITAVRNGQLELITSPGVAVTTFSQNSIDTNQVVFMHDGLSIQNGSFDFSLSDGGENDATTADDTFTISVTGAVPDTYTIDEDSALRVFQANGVLANDSVTAGAYVDSVNSSNTIGFQSVNSNGSFYYTPLGNFEPLDTGETATDTFDYTYSNDNGQQHTVTTTITITGVNDAPSLADLETGLIYYTENNPPVALTNNLSLADIDDQHVETATISITNNFVVSEDILAFNDQLGITGSYDTSNGILTLTGPASTADFETALHSVTYHNSSQNPTNLNRTVEFIVNDGETDSVAGYRDIELIPVNDPPLVLTNSGLSSIDGATTTITVDMLNDGDVDDYGTELTYTITNVMNGQLELSSDSGTAITAFTQADIDTGNLVFVHEAGTLANGSFDFTLADGGEDGTAPATGTFVINVSGALPDAYSTDENTPLIVSDPGVLSNDSFGTVVSVNNSSTSGVIVLNTSGGFEYDPNGAFDTLQAGQSATDSFDYTFIDGNGNGNQQTVTATITITGVNDAPTLSTIENQPAYYIENNAPVGLTGNLSVTDVDDANIVKATISITSNFVQGEDYLQFTNQLGITGSYNASIGKLTLTGTAPRSDFESAIRAVSYKNISDDPSTLQRTIEFSVNDGDDDSNTLTRNIEIIVKNDSPVVSTNIAAESIVGGITTITTAMLNEGDLDDDGTELTYNVTSSTNGQLELASNPGVLISTFTQSTIDTGNLVFVHDGLSIQNGSFDFVLLDGGEDNATPDTGTFVVNVTGALPDTYVTNEDAPLTIGAPGLLSNDSDGTSPVVTGIDTTNTNGSVSFNPDGSFIYETNGVFETLSSVQTATDTFDYTYDDGNGNQQTVSATITVTGVNDAPTLASLETTPAYFTENGIAVGLTDNLSITDIDGTHIDSAEVSIISNFVAGEDTLTFNPVPGISGSYDAPTGVLTLTGSATLADYESVLHTIGYSSNSEDPSSAVKKVMFVVSDGESESAALYREIGILPENDHPAIATNIGASTNVGGTVSITENMLNEGDPDDDGVELTYNVTAISNGQLELANNASGVVLTSFTQSDIDSGNLIFVHDGLSIQNGSFDFDLIDGGENNSSAASGTFVIDVIGSLPDSYTINEDTKLVVAAPGLLTNDSPGTSPFVAGIDTTNTLGSVSFNTDGSFEYTPASDFQMLDIGDSTTDTFEYTYDDGNGYLQTVTTTITVSGVNDAAILSTIENAPVYYIENAAPVGLTGNLQANDIDFNDQLEFQSATVSIVNNFISGEDVLADTSGLGLTSQFDSTTGVLTLTGPGSLDTFEAAIRSVAYQNNSDNPSLLPRTVEFTFNDGDTDSNTLKRIINVLPINDSPVIAENNSASSIVGGTTLITSSMLYEGDPDDDGADVTYQATAIANGRLELAGFAVTAFTQADIDSGDLNFVHDGLTTQNGSFDFSLSDGGENNATAATDTFTVNVIGALPDAYSVDEDATLTTAAPGLLANDSTGTAATVIAIDTTNTAGSVSFNPDGSFVYNTNGAFQSVNAGQVAIDSFDYTYDDGNGHLQTVTTTISVKGVNDAPSLSSIEVAPVYYVENGSAVGLTGNLKAFDIDNPVIESAAVSIVNNFTASEDTLSFINQPAITGTYDSTTGVMTLTGPATLVDFENAIHSVAYHNSNDDPSTVTRTVAFTINDGDIDSNTLYRDIEVVPINDPPVVAENNAAATFVGGTASITAAMLNEGDLDDNGLDLTYSVVSINNGQIEFNSNPGFTVSTFTQTDIDTGNLVFVHDGLSTGNGSFEFSLADGGENNTTPANGTFTVNVTGALPDTYTTTETTPLIVDAATGLLANDTSVAGSYVANIDTSATTGSVTVAPDGSFEYQASSLQNALATGQSVTDTFDYTYDDGTGNQQTVTVEVKINGINDAPTGTDKTISITEDTAHSFTLSDFNITDPESNTLLAVRIDSLPDRGLLTFFGSPVSAEDEILNSSIEGLHYQPVDNNNNISYTAFDFTVIDNGDITNGGTATALTPNKISFEIQGINDAPVGADNTVFTDEDTPYTFAAADFGFTDSDGHQFAAVIIDTLPTVGTLTLNGNNVVSGQSISAIDIQQLLFTPLPDSHGAAYDQLTFRVQDDGGTIGKNTDATANTMTIDVTSINDAPAGTDNAVITNEDTPYNFSISDFGFNDIDADNLAAIIIDSAPATGSLQLNGGNIVDGQSIGANDLQNLQFIAQPDDHGTAYDTFTFFVQDDGGTNGNNTSTTANSITINVTSVNDAPSGTNKTIVINEDTVHSFDITDFGFTDKDGNNLKAVRIDTLPANGLLTLYGTSVATGEQILNASIPDLKFQPEANGAGLAYTAFDFTVIDDGGIANGGVAKATTSNTIIIDVQGVNDAPQGTSNTITLNEDTSYNFNVEDFEFTDTDNHALQSIIVSDLPGNGLLTLNSAPVASMQVIPASSIDQLVFTPTSNFFGSITRGIGFQVQDDGGTENAGTATDPTPAVISINVAPVNDSPVLANQAFELDEGDNSLITSDILQAQDVDNGPAELLYTLTAMPQHGQLIHNGNEVQTGQQFTQADIDNDTIIYQHNNSTTSSDTFSVRVSDGGEDASIAASTTIEISINAVIAPAVEVVDQSHTLEYSEELDTADESVPSLLNGIDGEYTVELVEPPSHGELELQPDGNFTYQHNGSLFLTDSFTYRIVNSDGASSEATVNISIEPPIEEAFSEPVAKLVATPEPESPTEPEAEKPAPTQEQVNVDEEVLFAPPEPASATPAARDLPAPVEFIASVTDAFGGTDDFDDKINLHRKWQITNTSQDQSSIVRLNSQADIRLSLNDLFKVATDEQSMRNSKMVENFDEQRELLRDNSSTKLELATRTVTISSGLSIGYVIWLVRGGLLLGSVMSAMPAWRSFDPLPVLGTLGGDDENDTETLESMVEDDKAGPEADESEKKVA